VSKPIRVRMMQFDRPQDGPGLNVASACTANSQPNASKQFAIEYWPWVRHFRVEFTQPGRPPVVGFIHETRVSTWYPLDEEPVAPSATPEVKEQRGRQAGAVTR
jgi:hypothetical protein